MFRDNELLTGEDETMRQKDIEKFAFLYLCGQRDKDILAGKERMTFQDFDRLTYITDFLELDQMNLEIWNSENMRMISGFTINGLQSSVRLLQRKRCGNI